ncbi:MAG TPA: hypothetical protein VIY56_07545 [Vicinamibacterales bacterium]
MTTRRPRALVVLHETGYFRMYGSVVCELERRGWDVMLAFDTPDKRDAPQVPPGAGPHVSSRGAVPSPDEGRWINQARLTMDYARYLEPAFAGAGYLRGRVAKMLPPVMQWLTRCPTLPAWVIGACIGVMRAVERLVPVDARTLAFVRDVKPDLVVVSPLVSATLKGAGQTEMVKASQRLGVPAVVGVASWDHLTSKGLIRVVPDRVTVWNDVQKNEAVVLHRIPASRVSITGAQPLDHWFEPATDPDGSALRARLGVAAERRVILFVGSSKNMAPGMSEVRFVKTWLRAIRASTDDVVRQAFVLVRPHPSNLKQWARVDLRDPAATVHPASYSGMPLSAPEVEEFRSSLAASSAVVGVNTTAMIEAAIMRRPVLSVRLDVFAHSQRETLHFGYVSEGETGFVMVSDTLESHVGQLASVLADPGSAVAAGDRFVDRFVRPGGRQQSATSQVVDVLEQSVRSASTREVLVSVGSPGGHTERSRPA